MVSLLQGPLLNIVVLGYILIKSALEVLAPCVSDIFIQTTRQVPYFHSNNASGAFD